MFAVRLAEAIGTRALIEGHFCTQLSSCEYDGSAGVVLVEKLIKIEVDIDMIAPSHYIRG